MDLTTAFSAKGTHIQPHLSVGTSSPCSTLDRTFLHNQPHSLHSRPHLSALKHLNLKESANLCWFVGLFRILKKQTNWLSDVRRFDHYEGEIRCATEPERRDGEVDCASGRFREALSPGTD
jgi:hypothetical protein